eukprot:749912-Hanusia_phi.AAC.3
MEQGWYRVDEETYVFSMNKLDHSPTYFCRGLITFPTCGVTKVPSWISDLSELTCLDLSRNNIDNLPATMQHMSKLPPPSRACLFPESPCLHRVTSTSQLLELDLSFTCLEKVPKCLFLLTALQGVRTSKLGKKETQPEEVHVCLSFEGEGENEEENMGGKRQEEEIGRRKNRAGDETGRGVKRRCRERERLEFRFRHKEGERGEWQEEVLIDNRCFRFQWDGILRPWYPSSPPCRHPPLLRSSPPSVPAYPPTLPTPALLPQRTSSSSREYYLISSVSLYLAPHQVNCALCSILGAPGMRRQRLGKTKGFRMVLGQTFNLLFFLLFYPSTNLYSLFHHSLSPSTFTLCSSILLPPLSSHLRGLFSAHIAEQACCLHCNGRVVMVTGIDMVSPSELTESTAKEAEQPG